MTTPTPALAIFSLVCFAALVVVYHVAEICDAIRALIELRKTWRDQPDLVCGLVVIILMVTLTSCQPLRDRLFSSPATEQLDSLTAWD